MGGVPGQLLPAQLAADGLTDRGQLLGLGQHRRAAQQVPRSVTRTGSIILEHDGGGNRSQTVAALVT
jgi:hypothetical protein